MKINEKEFSDWGEEEVDYLINEEVPESEIIEYKRELDTGKDDIKKDVCAFANAKGGYIFYGIDEGDNQRKGIPIGKVPLQNKGKDRFDQQIGNQLSISIEPTRPVFETKLINITDSEVILILHVFEGVAKPYRVARDEGRFYTRQPEGNKQMSYIDIQNLFLHQNTKHEELSNFIEHRIQLFQRCYISQQYNNSSFMALYFFPLSSFSVKLPTDINVMTLYKDIMYNYNITGLWDCIIGRINADGVMIIPNLGNDQHIQIFRNGIIEMVSCSSFSKEEKLGKICRVDVLGNQIKAGCNIVKKVYCDLTMNEPIFASVCIVNAESSLLSRSIHPCFETGKIFDRDILISIESFCDTSADFGWDKLIKDLQNEFGYFWGKPRYSEEFDEISKKW